MVVALLHAGPERRCLDVGFERHLRRFRRVERERSGDILEEPAHPSHHHVPSAKLDLRMTRLKMPFSHPDTPLLSRPQAALTGVLDGCARATARMRRRTVVKATVNITTSTALSISDGPAVDVALE